MGYIYIIKNDINDKVYIGQTVQQLKRRFQKHLSDSKRLNLHFYRAIRKYGAEHFYIELLEECENNILDEREIYWINYYDSYNNGYNSTLGGEKGIRIDRKYIKELWDLGLSEGEIIKTTGNDASSISKILKYDLNISADEIKNRSFQNRYTISDEKLLSLWQEGKGVYQIYKIYGGNTLHKRLNNLGISDEEIKQRKSDVLKKRKPINTKIVYQYSLQGKLINSFNSIKEASENTGINRSGISRACSNEYPSSGGYIWSFDSNEIVIKEKIKNIENKNKKKVYQYNTNWVLLNEYESIAEATKSVGLKSASSISDVCNGRTKKAKGFYWSFKKY